MNEPARILLAEDEEVIAIIIHDLQSPEYRQRYVEVRFWRQPDSLRLTIQDQGEGFNWEDYLDFSPERASAWTRYCHGPQIKLRPSAIPG